MDYETLRKRYEAEYDLSTLNSANDAQNLDQLIRSQVLIAKLQDEMEALIADGNVADVQKYAQAIQVLSRSVRELEQQLKIDRRSRIGDEEMTVSEYVARLAHEAYLFLEQRLQKIECPECGAMVFRFAPVYDHTEIRIATTCPICSIMVTYHREEQPVVTEDWRKPYPVEITPARPTTIRNPDVGPYLVIDETEIPEGNSSVS